MESDARIQDKRVSRTKASIRNALIELSRDVDYSKITVTALAEKAGINRKTFYMYYKSIDDLMMSMVDTMIEKYRPVISRVDLTRDTFDTLGFFEAFSAIIIADIEEYRFLNKTGYLPALINKAKLMMIEVFLSQFGNDTRYRMFAEYAGAGILSMLNQWIETPDMSLAEFSDLAARIVLGSFNAIRF